ncbi:hypothetical protein CYMTET_13086 [Cymbomonas tetramitiformis]|uniref:Uncharacterized protein n=1 Tax=Cymbomonas tetramitiformis TaxID=36881 RepID=A0AAE0GJ64_9CHLO|nr:hypothetical protein CYMTET_13086 [Cymbomonas tetramitiformis]
MAALREELYRSWERCGQTKPPLELVKLEARGSVRFYPVEDDVGDAIDAPGRRRPPPPLPMAATTAVAGVSIAGAGPSGTEPSVHEVSTRDTLTRSPGSLSSDSACSDWSTIEAASRPTDSSLQTWLSPEEVKDLQHKSFLTVFMVSVLYCIFEDNDRNERDTFQFTDEYLQNEQRKFTGLAYVTALGSAPWVKPPLMLLEERLHSPAAIVEQVREAHLARRSWVTII